MDYLNPGIRIFDLFLIGFFPNRKIFLLSSAIIFILIQWCSLTLYRKKIKNFNQEWNNLLKVVKSIRTMLIDIVFMSLWPTSNKFFIFYVIMLPFFLTNNLFSTLAPKIVYAFLKNRPKNLFSYYLVDGQLTSII